MTPVSPPAGLSERSQALWLTVAGRTPGRLTMLEEALRTLDRLAEVRASLAGESLTLTSARSGVARVHPLLRVEAELSQRFVSIWQALGLHRETLDDILAGLKTL